MILKAWGAAIHCLESPLSALDCSLCCLFSIFLQSCRYLARLYPHTLFLNTIIIADGWVKVGDPYSWWLCCDQKFLAAFEMPGFKFLVGGLFFNNKQTGEKGRSRCADERGRAISYICFRCSAITSVYIMLIEVPSWCSSRTGSQDGVSMVQSCSAKTRHQLGFTS